MARAAREHEVVVDRPGGPGRARTIGGMGRARRARATQASAPSQREEQRALTRARLIDAAIAVFVAKGYGATTIDDIVVQAGVSRATFYLHFSSKLEVISAIREPWSEGTDELWALLPGAVSGGRDGLSNWLHLALDYWEAVGPAFRAVRQAGEIEPEPSGELAALREEAVRSIVKGLAGGPALGPDEQQVRARAAWGLLHALFDDYASDGWRYGRSTVHTALLDAWTALLT